MNQTLSSYRNSYIHFVEKCFSRNVLPKSHNTFANNFFIGSMDKLGTLSIEDVSDNKFLDIKNLSLREEHVEIKDFLKKSLPFLLENVKEYANLGGYSYETPKKKKITLESIFIGLENRGNNDGSYDNLPSAYSLSTFNINDKD